MPEILWGYRNKRAKNMRPAGDKFYQSEEGAREAAKNAARRYRASDSDYELVKYEHLHDTGIVPKSRHSI